MKMQETRNKAKPSDMHVKRIKKADVVRQIQIAEGGAPCYQTSVGSCDQIECCWRRDCFD